MRSRSGFTLIEMLMVFVIVGVITALTIPKLSKYSERNAVRAAKRQMQSYIAVARASAIRRGQPAQFHLSSNTMWVTVSTSATTSAVVRDSVQLGYTQSVTITPTTDSIVFNTRGFSSNLSSTRNYVITRGAATDSLCVSKLGMIAPRCGI